VFGNREFVRDHPVATKRFLRAILKANDMCAAEPERTAQRLVDAGFPGRYEYALQTLTELPYARWREFDAEDSLRFYALRLHDAGMIQSSPNKIIAEGYVAAVIGTLVGNPWTLPFLLLASYQLGHALLGGPAAPIEAFQDWTLGSFFAKLEAVFWPMAIGSVPLGLGAGLVTYFALVRIVAAYQKSRARRRQSRRALRAQPASPDAGVP
jgi:Uncharacterized protein conserved in bacteria (DUF2062)